MKKKRDKTVRTVRAVAAAMAALTFMLSLSLSSCSIIQINYEKFGITTESGTGTSHSTKPTEPGSTTLDGETSYLPPNEYEYTGKQKAEALLSEVNFDFGGNSVFIRTTNEDEAARILSFSEDEENTYSAAKYERCRMVEEALNCKLRYVSTTLDEMIVDMKAAIGGEDYYADLLAVTGEDLAILAKEGLLLNLNSLAFFDIDAEYFHPSTSGLAAGNCAFGAVSYATIDPDEISCVFYDTEKVSGDINELVKSGRWTWDELMSRAADGGISTDAIPDDDGNNIVDAERVMRLAASSSALRFVSNERGKTPTVTLPDGASDAAAVCRALLGGDGAAQAGINVFVSGESAFHIGTLADMTALSTVDMVWDIAPMPKLSPSQSQAQGREKYVSAMPKTSLILAAPINTTNPDGVSALIRALAASSYEYLRDAYIEYHMFNTVRRESTLEMLDYIYSSADYDFADVFGGVDDDVFAATRGLFAELVSDPDADAEKLFKKRQSNADEVLTSIFGVPDQ